MNQTQKSVRVMKTLTYLAATLFVVSALSLGARVATANAPPELCPELYVHYEHGYVTPEQKTVYFTFDDGPSKNTEKVLDMLMEEEVKATFFVCAQYEDREFSTRMLRRMRDEGHTIALHTYTHKTSDTYTSLEGYLEDLCEIDAFVYEATGLHPELMRFPGGSTTVNCDKALMKRIADEVTRRGFIFHDWTIPSGDDGAHPKPAGEIARTILNGLGDRQQEIVLCHDNATPTTTTEAVRQCIREMRGMGYTFDRLTPQVEPVLRVYD